MNAHEATTDGALRTDLAGLAAHVGGKFGPTPWRSFSQVDINQFAALTDDYNFIHVEPERAAHTPFGGTIAHGYLTLAMLAPISMALVEVTDLDMGVNYGLDRVRFPAPLRVGTRFRGRGELVEVREVPGGVQAKLGLTIEVEGSEKPAVVAESLVRYYA